MMNRILCVIAAGILVAGPAAAQQKPAPGADSTIRRAADGHPDLSGNWTYAIDLAPVVLKTVADGKVTTTTLDQSARHRAVENVPGASRLDQSALLQAGISGKGQGPRRP